MSTAVQTNSNSAKAVSGKITPEGLIGRKLGMTQIFTATGKLVGVTAIEVGPCFVLAVRSPEAHGYSAVQLGFSPKKAQRVTKADIGQFAAAGKGAFSHVQEVRCDAAKLGWTTLGQELKAGEVFKEGETVDISGTTIGRGFAGVVKKFKVGGHPATRGTHEYRRHIGAIGMRKFPHHVHKGKHMPGHLGNEKVTIRNLKVVAVRAEDNVILVQGAIPGHPGSLVTVRRAKKGYGKLKAA